MKYEIYVATEGKPGGILKPLLIEGAELFGGVTISDIQGSYVSPVTGDLVVELGLKFEIFTQKKGVLDFVQKIREAYGQESVLVSFGSGDEAGLLFQGNLVAL